MDTEIFSKRLSLLRVSRNLSVREFAGLLNLTPSYISKLESNKNLPSMATIYDIVILFGVSFEWLAGLTSTPYNSDILKSIEHIVLKYPIFNKSSYSSTPYINDGIYVSLPESYYDIEQRKITYNLEERSHIIFLFHKLASYGLLNKDLSEKEKEAYIFNHILLDKEPKSTRLTSLLISINSDLSHLLDTTTTVTIPLALYDTNYQFATKVQDVPYYKKDSLEEFLKMTERLYEQDDKIPF